MPAFVFDDQGERWDAGSRRLADILQASIAGEELANYVVKNLGYVWVSEEANGTVRVRLRPKVVSPIAFSSLCYYLADTKPGRVVLSRLEQGWQHEFYGAQDGVLRQLLHLMPASHDARSHDFVRQPKSIDSVDPANPLQELFKLWRQSQGPLQYDSLGRLLQEGLHGRYVLVHTGRTASDVFLEEVGPGFLSYDDTWLSRSSGLRVEDQPDYYYGRWVAEAYRHTTHDRAPRLEDVDAIICTPRLGRSRVRYTRLIVPMQMPSGKPCLLGASLIDTGIDLRAAAEAR
jgi:hypothetical protein